MGKVLVYVDTTTTFVDLTLSKTPWAQLLTLCARGDVEVAMSEVVLQETVRHRARKIDESRQALESSIQRMREKLAAIGTLGGTVNWGDVSDAEPEVLFDSAQNTEALRERLEGLGVKLVPLPDVSHADVPARDLGMRKPFQSSGKGYRDALIWESLKPLLGERQHDWAVFFVTDNTGDYCDGENNIHPELLAEVAHLDVDLSWARDLDDLLKRDALGPAVALIAKTDEELHDYLKNALSVAAEAPDDYEPDVNRLITDALLEGCATLVGQSVSTDAVREWGRNVGSLDFAELELPSEVSEMSVNHIDPDASSADWAAYESYDDGTLLVRATIRGIVTLEGFVHKADYYISNETEMDLLEWDWNDHTAHVAVSRSARLVFQLRVESGLGLVEEIEFEEAEQIT